MSLNVKMDLHVEVPVVPIEALLSRYRLRAVDMTKFGQSAECYIADKSAECIHSYLTSGSFFGDTSMESIVDDVLTKTLQLLALNLGRYLQESQEAEGVGNVQTVYADDYQDKGFAEMAMSLVESESDGCIAMIFGFVDHVKELGVIITPKG